MNLIVWNLEMLLFINKFPKYKYTITNINENNVLGKNTPSSNSNPHPFPISLTLPCTLWHTNILIFCTPWRFNPCFAHSLDANLVLTQLSHCFLLLDAFWAYFWVHQHICKNIIIYNENMITQVLSKYC